MATEGAAVTRATSHPRLFPTQKVGTGTRPGLEAQLAAAGFPEPEPEFVFAPSIGRNWRLDYAWPALKIALEIEGGGFGRYIVITEGYERKRGQSLPIKPGTVIRFGGRHNTGDGLQNDAVKYNRAAILGWLVIRATTTMVRDGIAITELTDAFRARGVELVPPAPPPQTQEATL